MKDLQPPPEIVFDPAYVDRVTAEIVTVIGEAQAMITAGNIGPDLITLAHHAKDLHEILAEQLLEAPPAIASKFGPISEEMGQGIARLVTAIEGGPIPPPRATH